MKIIIFDFEVFRYNTLLGTIILNKGGQPIVYQTWDKEEIKNFYNEHKKDIWVGHNNSHYDNHILNAILFNKDTYELSKKIILEDYKPRLNIYLNYYDIMSWDFTSLKVLEACLGKNISESQVDFDVMRELTQEEKLETESYNRDDLYQTLDSLKLTKSKFQLRFDLMKEFKLPLNTLYMTETQIAEKVLNAQPIEGIETMKIKPIIYPQMKVNNKQILDFYLNEDFREGKTLDVPLCGVEHRIAAGGIHAAKKKYYTKEAIYCDVSGYYNLVMINYDLLPRTMPEASKELYIYMYHEQLKLKKINPVKRNVYKTILLAVFGAMLNKYTKFYDPAKGSLVTMVGQMFLVDLLEKLEGKAEIVQSNTDGIIIEPLVDESIVMDIIKEWQERTGFVLKTDKIYDVYQRDVNCYMYKDDKGNIHTKGEALKYYENWNNPFSAQYYNAKEPVIFHYCLVNYFMKGIKPEDTIEQFKNTPLMFQYVVKLKSYDYLTFENNKGTEKLQKVNRVFASKLDGMIYKNKNNGKHDKYQNLPDKVFVHNTEVNIINNIDFNYYIRRAYERIDEFVPPVTLL